MNPDIPKEINEIPVTSVESLKLILQSNLPYTEGFSNVGCY